MRAASCRCLARADGYLLRAIFDREGTVAAPAPVCTGVGFGIAAPLSRSETAALGADGGVFTIMTSAGLIVISRGVIIGLPWCDDDGAVESPAEETVEPMMLGMLRCDGCDDVNVSMLLSIMLLSCSIFAMPCTRSCAILQCSLLLVRLARTSLVRVFIAMSVCCTSTHAGLSSLTADSSSQPPPPCNPFWCGPSNRT